MFSQDTYLYKNKYTPDHTRLDCQDQGKTAQSKKAVFEHNINMVMYVCQAKHAEHSDTDPDIMH